MDRSSDDVELTGTVEAIEDDAHCSDGVGGPYKRGDGYSVRIASDGEALTLGFVLPWQAPLFATGDMIHVRYRRGIEPFAGEGLPPSGSVVIRDREGQLLFWIAETYDGIDEADVPPEITMKRGATSCSYALGEDGCEVVTRSSLRVDTGSGEVEVPYGDERDVGDFTVLHADSERHANAAGELCAVAYHRISVAMARRSIVED